MAVFWLKKV